MPTPLRQQIRGGRKGRAERRGLGQRPHNIAKKSDRSATRASSDAWPKNSEAMAMRSGTHGGLMCPLEKGVRGIKTNARSVRVWDRVQMKNKTRAVSPLWGNLVALSLPLYRGQSAACKLLSDSCLTVLRVVKKPTLKTPKALIVSTLRVASCIRQ